MTDDQGANTVLNLDKQQGLLARLAQGKLLVMSLLKLIKGKKMFIRSIAGCFVPREALICSSYETIPETAAAIGVTT